MARGNSSVSPQLPLVVVIALEDIRGEQSYGENSTKY